MIFIQCKVKKLQLFTEFILFPSFSDSRYLGGNWVGGFVGFQHMSVLGIFHLSAVTSFTTKVFLVHGHVNLCLVCVFFIKNLSKGYDVVVLFT